MACGAGLIPGKLLWWHSEKEVRREVAGVEEEKMEEAEVLRVGEAGREAWGEDMGVDLGVDLGVVFADFVFEDMESMNCWLGFGVSLCLGGVGRVGRRTNA